MKTAGLALLAVAFNFSALGTTADAKGILLAIPVIVSPPAAPVPEVVSASGPLLRQSLRVEAAVRTADPLSVPLGRKNLTVPAGTLFVKAASRSGSLYCQAISEKSDGWLTFFDLGLCLSDENDDFTAETLFISDVKNSRARTVFEITRDDTDASIPSNVQLYAVEADKLPSAEVRLTYLNTSNNPASPQSMLMFDHCVQGELKTTVVKAKMLCGQVQWPRGVGIQGPNSGWRPRLKVGEPTEIHWSGVDMTMTPQANGVTNIQLNSAIPEGRAVVVQTGRWATSNDYLAQTSIFLVIPVAQGNLADVGRKP